MKKTFFICTILVCIFTNIRAQWKPVGNRIVTPWTEKVDVTSVLPEYPRPIMERNEWKNLNGLWEYAITDVGKSCPKQFDGQILVPFAVESALSGVGKAVGKEKELWYCRTFNIPSSWKNKKILLHFGAVDWKADVWVNGIKVGNHTGGFTPFSFDITAALVAKGDNQLMVKVWDPTDDGYQPRGKQVKNPGGIYYTPVTGIWQTVWLEPVSEKYIEKLRITPDIDKHLLTVEVDRNVVSDEDLIEVKVYDESKLIATARSINREPLVVSMPQDSKLWSPDSPFLYTLKISLKTKDMGFNMIRKHVKVEPARWYAYCDKLGIIVWQDMPNGDRGQQWQNLSYYEGPEMYRSSESEACYRKEWKEIIDYLYSYPCISTWVPFNEAWGQFKTVEIAEWTKRYDPTRLVNPASGGNHFTCGDMLDLHNYPTPDLYLYDAQRATVLGEYGGIGLIIKGHLWEPDRNWGYIQFNSSKEATDEYLKYADQLYDLIFKGFSAAVYTQTTDVEVEVNGLITYDRRVIKLDEKRVNEINSRICKSLNR